MPDELGGIAVQRLAYRFIIAGPTRELQDLPWSSRSNLRANHEPLADIQHRPAYSTFPTSSTPTATLAVPARACTIRRVRRMRKDTCIMGHMASTPTATMPSKLPIPNDHRYSAAVIVDGETTTAKAVAAPLPPRPWSVPTAYANDGLRIQLGVGG